jgi:hypothetical protein
MHLPLHRVCLAATALFAFALGACGDPRPVTPADALTSGAPFVPVYPDGDEPGIEAARAALTAEGIASLPDHHFYLAIHKRELASRWFLSAYLTQAHPGPLALGAATSVGTRVVSFKVQNGKLFLFDVGDKAWSDAFQPEVVLEAYPIVSGFAPFERLRGASDYLLIDPAAGLNRFSLLGERAAPVKVELTFSQRFRNLPDGAGFDQVFTGATPAATRFTSTGPVLDPGRRVSGTLSIGLRRYTEGEGYTPTRLPSKEHYFRSPALLVRNQGTTAQVAAKWNLHPGGKPIVWAISGIAERLRDDPALAELDFAGAIKTGIESWNEAFGWKALEARMSRPDESPGDDDVNYFLFDADRSVGAAFANWRMNPNTGEIRGASVYFPIARVRTEVERRVDAGAPALDAGGRDAGAHPAEPPPRDALPGAAPARLSWGPAQDESLCELVPSSLDELLAQADAFVAGLSRKERVERYVAFIAAHEVGHTLGLRHNFKGSLLPPTSSVMEYVVDVDAMANGGKLGPYDLAAIRHLYGLSSELPVQPFCSDDQLGLADPDCRQRDRGAEPLTDWAIPLYRAAVEDRLLRGFGAGPSAVHLQAVVDYVRTGGIEEREVAWEALFAGFGATAAPLAAASPSVAARADGLSRLVIQRLFLPPPSAPGSPPVAVPQLFGVVAVRAIAELQAQLLNVDGVRTAGTRRLCVDALKLQQTPAAYGALLDARDELAQQLPTLTGAPALDARDLVSRIDRATSPYFD